MTSLSEAISSFPSSVFTCSTRRSSAFSMNSADSVYARFLRPSRRRRRSQPTKIPTKLPPTPPISAARHPTCHRLSGHQSNDLIPSKKAMLAATRTSPPTTKPPSIPPTSCRIAVCLSVRKSEPNAHLQAPGYLEAARWNTHKHAFRTVSFFTLVSCYQYRQPVAIDNARGPTHPPRHESAATVGASC